MNPLTTETINTFVRGIMISLGAVLTYNEYLTDAEWQRFAGMIAPVLFGFAWQLMQNHKSRQKQLVSAAAPAGSTERQVEALVKAGESPPVTLPKDAAPQLASDFAKAHRSFP